MTTTRSDLNKQVGLDVGEYPGFRLADFGFTGAEDFAITAEVSDIPRLEVVGQFGLYAGARADRAIRGGVLRQPEADRYSLFLVNNDGGVDRDTNEVGLTATGDHLRFALGRTGGDYSLLVENLTRRSTNTLTIAPSTVPRRPGRPRRRALRGQHPERRPQDPDGSAGSPITVLAHGRRLEPAPSLATPGDPGHARRSPGLGADPTFVAAIRPYAPPPTSADPAPPALASPPTSTESAWHAL